MTKCQCMGRLPLNIFRVRTESKDSAVFFYGRKPIHCPTLRNGKTRFFSFQNLLFSKYISLLFFKI